MTGRDKAGTGERYFCSRLRIQRHRRPCWPMTGCRRTRNCFTTVGVRHGPRGNRGEEVNVERALDADPEDAAYGCCNGHGGGSPEQHSCGRAQHRCATGLGTECSKSSQAN